MAELKIEDLEATIDMDDLTNKFSIKIGEGTVIYSCRVNDFTVKNNDVYIDVLLERDLQNFKGFNMESDLYEATGYVIRNGELQTSRELSDEKKENYRYQLLREVAKEGRTFSDRLLNELFTPIEQKIDAFYQKIVKFD